MQNTKHPEIESAFFEYSKMKAFLDNGICIHVPTVYYAPIDVAQRYFSFTTID